MDKMKDILDILQFVEKNNNSAFFYTPNKTGSEQSYVFGKASETIVCKKSSEIDSTLSKIDLAIKKYDFAYGYLSFETGYYFEERLKDIPQNLDQKLISFSFFNLDEVNIIPSNEILFHKVASLIKPHSFSIHDIKLSENETDYKKNVDEIKRLISIGDTYQVNYTIKANFNFKGSLTAFVTSLIFNQSAEYTAFINDNNQFVISISPELFIKTNGREIISKPMKGTIQRGVNLADDNRKSEELSSSIKDKAENIMIVDLLRNDIGKISNVNSVYAYPLFEVEKYESLFQMTSTVGAVLKTNKFSSIIKNIFPCGSISGAPKIKTMEIIKKVEKKNRGIYTGTIGIVNKGNLNFNIPIRTLTINKSNNHGKMGIGSGIVWDSNPSSEFEEVKLKSHFLTKSYKYFELLETMLIENGNIFLRNLHLNRLKNAADYFIFNFDKEKVENILDKILEGLDIYRRFKLRLTLTKWGEIKFNLEQILPIKNYSKVIVSKHRINPKDRFVYFKTTNRNLYNSEFNKWKNCGYDDVIFVNTDGYITEGAISNIMISKENKFITPPINSGLLNGCYREHLISKNDGIIERELTIDDLFSADGVYIFNSIRKMIKISEVHTD